MQNLQKYVWLDKNYINTGMTLTLRQYILIHYVTPPITVSLKNNFIRTQNFIETYQNPLKDLR